MIQNSGWSEAGGGRRYRREKPGQGFLSACEVVCPEFRLALRGMGLRKTVHWSV